jgi:hypothetical protein
MSSKEKKHKEGKKDEKMDEQSRKLPKRLKLGAFSKVVGHRPMGLQIEQCKYFAKRFPTEFRLAAMGKVVLPCQGKLPYLTADGTLPSPILSAVNALKYLELHPDQLEHGDARAKKEINMVINDGIQVEWVEFNSFLEWMLYTEGASVPSSVRVLPHVLDTAIMYVQFLSSKQALPWARPKLKESGVAVAASSSDVVAVATGVHSKQVEAAFLASLRGKSVHRLKDARTLLGVSEPAALADLAAWRKRVHHVQANGVA